VLEDVVAPAQLLPRTACVTKLAQDLTTAVMMPLIPAISHQLVLEDVVV
jgi:hypothetical protein